MNESSSYTLLVLCISSPFFQPLCLHACLSMHMMERCVAIVDQLLDSISYKDRIGKVLLLLYLSKQ